MQKRKKINKDLFVIMVVTNLDDDDFKIIFDNLEYKDKVLIICDENSIEGYPKKNLNYIIDDFNNYNKLIKKIIDWQKKYETKNIINNKPNVNNNKIKFCGIIGLDEEYHYMFSKKISKRFNLDYYSKETLDSCSNKYLQRIVLKKNKINVPKFELINIKSKKTNIKYPNVIKPICGFASYYVKKNQNCDELINNIKEFNESNKKSNDVMFKKHKIIIDKQKIIINPKKELLVEEFIKGDEYSCDFLVDNNKIKIIRVTKKIDNNNYFSSFDGFYLFNPDYENKSDFKISKLKNVCKKIAKALNLKFGINMVDFKLYKNKIYVIETTVRPGISTFMELMVYLYKTTSFNYLIQQKLCLENNFLIPNSSGMVFYINTNKTGFIKKFDTTKIEKEKNKLGILLITKYYKERQTMNEVPIGQNHAQWLGYIIVKNVSIEKIQNKINEITKMIDIQIE
jgi:D-alanine-D-alanine ligase-like ATP-grasp enzyme